MRRDPLSKAERSRGAAFGKEGWAAGLGGFPDPHNTQYMFASYECLVEINQDWIFLNHLTNLFKPPPPPDIPGVSRFPGGFGFHLTAVV